ncbi:LytR/AlgR family response regulator transcription factor [Listeria grandensis]|uniref:LytR/AlgR family response regulator transcription factor n=1 Tax=Listeria grandensis TaxID=1494963 RepID=UPI00164E1FA5|nr:LytTR family DNA-binding domain-containing protein [Listeria grandensis]MBC6316180.1 response regulator transcription factor [Listeria grandensis]
MKRLYVIENEKIQRDSLLFLLNENKTVSSMKFCIADEIETPEALLEDIKKYKGSSHIYFLDINLGTGLDGIELALKVREIDPTGLIIFVTALKSRFFEAVNLVIEPLAYLIKSNFTLAELQAKLEGIMELIRSRYEKVEALVLEIGRSIYKIKHENIYFIETQPQSKKTIIHLEKEVMVVSMPMKGLKERLLYTEFLLNLQAYIINPKKVENLDLRKGMVLFKNKDTIHAGKRTMTKIKRELIAHGNII